jgi:EAL domain-containing protein (putative c-di-GMP-specific phosphodiesterase class I)
MRHIRQVIETCRDMGVSFSLDDFGAGCVFHANWTVIPQQTGQ